MDYWDIFKGLPKSSSDAFLVKGENEQGVETRDLIQLAVEEHIELFSNEPICEELSCNYWSHSLRI